MLCKYCTCAKRTSWVKQLAGEECMIVFSAWACKHTYMSLLWDYVHTVVSEKCLVCIGESVLLQVVCTGPLTCVKHTLNCTKSLTVFSCDVVRSGVGEMFHVWTFRHETSSSRPQKQNQDFLKEQNIWGIQKWWFILKKIKILYWHVWFHKGSLTSTEALNSTKGSL